MMKQRILDKVEESFKKAEVFYGRTFSRPSNIIFQRTGSTAGHCHYGRKELMFQLTLAENEGDKFINRTPAHEVAHWIDKEVNGYSYTASGRRDVHGKKWQYIMKYVMKQEASRCHSYDTSQVKGKRNRTSYDYVCANGHNLLLSSVIHNRLMKGRGYRCKCGGKLTLKVPSKEEQIEALKKQLAALETRYETY
jgi:SprT protein